MPFDTHELAAQIRLWGNTLKPGLLEDCQALYAPHHEREPYVGMHVTRDLAYGDHQRQRLDVFQTDAGVGARAAVVFVHGGGFVGGDKKRPGTPFHDNVALWAVHHGMVGVNMTYRVAPAAPWPAGAEDIAAALNWLRANAAEYGIATDRLWLLGTSAGAVHVANYVALENPLGSDVPPEIAGAIMLSGLYDIETAEQNALLRAYFGKDTALYRGRSSLQGLIEARLPLMFGVAEHDPTDFEAQALQLVNAWYRRNGRWPRLARLMGHNHFTSTFHLNTPDEYLGNLILAFMKEEKR